LAGAWADCLAGSSGAMLDAAKVPLADWSAVMWVIQKVSGRALQLVPRWVPALAMRWELSVSRWGQPKALRLAPPSGSLSARMLEQQLDWPLAQRLDSYSGMQLEARKDWMAWPLELKSAHRSAFRLETRSVPQSAPPSGL
jgi:hypothetical protein